MKTGFDLGRQNSCDGKTVDRTATADGGRKENSIWVGANGRLGEESPGKNQSTGLGQGWTARAGKRRWGLGY
jgi:hypothetical protein